MDESGANIDIVFRNGLKDFEVIPPPDVWDNIRPVIKRKQRPYILIRAAAIITIVLSVSFLAYRLSREISTELNNFVSALNQEALFPGNNPDFKRPLTVTGKENNFIRSSQIAMSESAQDLTIVPGNEKNPSPAIAMLPETESLSINKANPLYEPHLASLNSSKKNVFMIKDPDLQYFPGNTAVNGTDRWSIAAMASPTYYSRFNSGKDVNYKQLMASEQPLISYSGGISLTYKINKRFSIQSGLYYSSLGQEVDGINSFGGFKKYDYSKGAHNFEVLTTSGTVYTNNADVFLIADGSMERVLTNITRDVFDPEKASLQYINNTMRQNFSYLELPVILKYKVVDKTIDLNLIGGISYNLLVNNSAYTMLDGSKYPIGKTEGLNLITLSSSIGMGMEYSLSNKLSLNLEPTFRYYMNPFNELAGSKIHPYSFGIFSGVSYKF